MLLLILKGHFRIAVKTGIPQIEYAYEKHSTTTWIEFCHFLTTPLRGQFLYPEREQTWTFLEPPYPPPHPASCPRSC